jgi:hypothetical protein
VKLYPTVQVGLALRYDVILFPTVLQYKATAAHTVLVYEVIDH